MPVKSIQALFDVAGHGCRDVVFGVDAVGLLHAWFSFMAGMAISQASDYYAELM
jgi:hypothetical protein